MKLSIQKLWILCISFLSVCVISAQERGVLWDKANNLPVTYANIFVTQNNEVKGTTSDSEGLFSINFSFDKLNITHINYQKKIISEVSDTIFLTPKENMLGEVVVDNKEPEWIRPFFYRFIDEKANLYKPMPDTLTYIYSTYNLSDNNGYWFENNGQMAIPSSKEKEGRYFILPEEGIIHYKNKTAGCDFTNMKRMIYHDFVDEIDKKYIMRHLFMINHAYKNGNKKVVQIFFKSKKYDTDDKGYITIDTAKCVVLSVKRKTGFKYNLKNKTNSFMRNTFRSVRGFKYTNWLVNFDVHYQQLNGSFYPAVYHYKVYIASTSSKGKDKRTLFESSESEIKLQQPQQQPKGTYIELPRPWYMKIIVTKKERLKEEKLQKIPKKHIVY